ncbi:MAG: 3-isopropylmalate dehydratase small subunit, partial [Thermoleophilia bacterium]|nr:3-isopropylmalate dehydratase small subunit [Thermoleophilia bacterium]
IFFSNCTKNGFLPVVLSEDECRALGESGHGRIHLEEQLVSWDGGEARFEIDPEIKRRLLGGLDDIALTLHSEDEIETFEAGPGGSYGPVTTSLG